MERFGDKAPRYLTVFNDSADSRTATITLEGPAPKSSRELVRGQSIACEDCRATLSLDGEDVAVLELK